MDRVRGRFMNQFNKVEVDNVEVSLEYTEPEPPKPGFLRSLFGSKFRAWRGSCTVSEAQGTVLHTFGAYRLELQDGRAGNVNVDDFDQRTGRIDFVGTGPLK
jgi:hypothetical protein